MNSDSALLRAMARYMISTGSEATRWKNEMLKILNAPAPEPAFSGDFKADAERVLMCIGTPTHLIGFRYCVEAIAIVAENHTERKKMSAICSEIGKANNASSESVRIAIRNLCETVFNRATTEVLVKYFGDAIDWDTGKISMPDFVYRLAAYIRRRV